MTQLWPEGVPIAVETAGEELVAFRWQQHRHRVQTVVERWVVHDEWWRDEIWRAYVQIETVDGLLCVIYQDLLALSPAAEQSGGAWFLERIYD